jgi:hypothetical protein
MARDNEENNRIYNEQKKRAQELRDSAARDQRLYDEISDTLTRSRERSSSAKSSSQSGKSGGGNGVTQSGCFPAGTKVETPYGTRDIARLSTGDFVLAVDLQTSRTRKRKILKIDVHHSNRIWALTFSDGSAVRTTAAHSFLVAGKWEKASRIYIGDTLAVSSADGLSEKTVISSEATESMEPVYNLIVEGDFNFIADGVLAHSFTRLRAVKIAIWSCIQKWRADIATAGSEIIESEQAISGVDPLPQKVMAINK